MWLQLFSRPRSSSASSFVDDMAVSHLDPPDYPSSETCSSSRRTSTGSRITHGPRNTVRPLRTSCSFLGPDGSRAQGDVMRFTSLGETTIILSSARAVSDLLESRGASRVRFHSSPRVLTSTTRGELL